MLLSERSQSEMTTYCMLTIIWHFGKGKTIETIKQSVVARSCGGDSKEIGGTRGFLGHSKYSAWFSNVDIRYHAFGKTHRTMKHKECIQM